VSATLTRDPQKLSLLRLVNPKHFNAHQLRADSTFNASDRASGSKYAMPPGLSEYTVECKAEQKPIVLLALLLERLRSESASGEGTQVDKRKGIVVVFTSSLDSTHRLARLLQLLWTATGVGEAEAVAEFSSALGQNERSRLLSRCDDPLDLLRVVVCSDGMSRGLDIEHVSEVVNYDVPAYAKTYVHRCGRTARARNKGAATTLLKGGQVGQFHRMRQLVQQPDRVERRGIQKGLLQSAMTQYGRCIRALRDVIEAEEDGALNRADTEQLAEYLAAADDE
jgi:ATP-dependent RNA helicase DDX51/DBP6